MTTLTFSSIACDVLVVCGESLNTITTGIGRWADGVKWYLYFRLEVLVVCQSFTGSLLPPEEKLFFLSKTIDLL